MTLFAAAMLACTTLAITPPAAAWRGSLFGDGDPLCDREEVVTEQEGYYHHSVREACSVKVKPDGSVCAGYVYSYDYSAVRTEAGWQESGPYEVEHGTCA